MRMAVLVLAVLAAPVVAQETEAPPPAEFDLSTLGGVEESTAPNGQRVLRELGPSGVPTTLAPVEAEGAVEADDGSQYMLDRAPPAEETGDTTENCTETANGYRCTGTVIRGDDGEAAERVRRRLRGDPD